MAVVPTQDDIAMSGVTMKAALPAQTSFDVALARTGVWLRDRQNVLRRAQWLVVVAYVALLVTPALLPLPQGVAHIWTNVTLFAQFVFWGLWWPFVLLSMVLVGRAWCGLLCPEGALTERMAEHGRGGAIPHWLLWKGWPFLAFVLTTLYGQLTSVYQYPRPALVVLGGSTVAAMVAGYYWGRNKRVWCRFLCPVTGVFTLLAKLAPLHFRVDRQAWETWEKPHGAHPQSFNCAPLVAVRTMRGAGACHMCGRCADFRGAVTLARRSPNHEIVHVAGDMPNKWQSALILFGLNGVAAGAFLWGSSALYVAIRQALAEKLVDAGLIWPISPVLPWWLLTNYPEMNDAMTPLDGFVLVLYMLGTAALFGLSSGLCVALAARVCEKRFDWVPFHHFTQALIPVAGCGVFLGLSSLTVTMLKAEGIVLPFLDLLRASLLIGAALWSLWLSWSIARTRTASFPRAILAVIAMSGATLVGCAVWASLFWRIF